MISYLKGSMMKYISGNKREATKKEPEDFMQDFSLASYSKDHRTAVYKDADIKVYVNAGDIEKSAVKSVIARLQELGLSPNSGKLCKSVFNVKKVEDVLGSVTSKRIADATLVYSYSCPSISTRTVRFAVKYDSSKMPSTMISPIVVDKQNQKINAESKAEFGKYFYDSCRGIQADANFDPKLAVYDGEKYIEVEVKNKSGAIAGLAAKGIECRDRMAAEGIDHPFIEICAYNPNMRKAIDEVLTQFNQDVEGIEDSIANQEDMEIPESEDSVDRLNAILDELSSLYTEALEIENSIETAIDDASRQEAQIRKDEIQARVDELEREQAIIHRDIGEEEDLHVPDELMRDDNEEWEELVESLDVPEDYIGGEAVASKKAQSEEETKKESEKEKEQEKKEREYEKKDKDREKKAKAVVASDKVEVQPEVKPEEEIVETTKPTIIPVVTADRKAQAAKFKTGDRILVESLGRTGTVSDIKKIENTGVLVYILDLDGLTGSKLFSEEAIKDVKPIGDSGSMMAPGETLGGSIEEKKLENFPATATVDQAAGITASAVGNILDEKATVEAARKAGEAKKTGIDKKRESTSQEALVEKYNKSYKTENLGSGFYKPIKTAETIIKDVTQKRYPTFQDAYDAYTNKWATEAKDEVKQVLARLKVTVK